MSYVDWIGPSLLPIILLSCAGCLMMVGTSKGSSSLRRLVATAFLLSLVVVLASYWIKVPEAPTTSLTDMERVAIMVSTEVQETWSWQWLLFAPAFYVALQHIVGLASLARSRRRFVPGPEDLTKDRLYVCPEAVTAYAFGYVKPTIVLPSSYLELEHAELIAVIRHEEAHLRQGDPTLIPLINLLQGLLWWNPFVHLLARAWKIESERAADDAALASGIPPARYARQLINLAQGLAGRPPLAGSAFIGRGRLKTRILAVVNPEIRRKNMKASHKYMTVAGCTAAALALSVAASARWHSAQVVNEKGPDGAVWQYVETTPGHFVWTYKVVEGRALKQEKVPAAKGQVGEVVFQGNAKPEGTAKVVFDGKSQDGKAFTGENVIEVEGRPLYNAVQFDGKSSDGKSEWTGVSGVKVDDKDSSVKSVKVTGDPGKPAQTKSDKTVAPGQVIKYDLEWQVVPDGRGDYGVEWKYSGKVDGKLTFEGKPSDVRWRVVPDQPWAGIWRFQDTSGKHKWRFHAEKDHGVWRFSPIDGKGNVIKGDIREVSGEKVAGGEVTGNVVGK